MAKQPKAAHVMTSASMPFSPGPDWKSIRDAAVYVGFDEHRGPTKIRTALKQHEAFRAEGATTSVTLDGYDIPPITYVNIHALEAYKHALETTPKRGPQRDTRRYLITVPHTIKDDVIDTLMGRYGITLKEANRPRKSKSAATNDTGINVDYNTAA